MTDPSMHGKYRTRQYDELLDYIKTIPRTHFTVNDIHAHFQGLGKNIGTATLYRHLDRLVSEGCVKKYIMSPRTPACYEYVGKPSEPEDGCKSNYHCLCEICGRLIHLKCEEITELTDHLFAQHHFRIDPMRTVFYGICEDCLEGEGKTEAESAICGKRSTTGSHAAGCCSCHHPTEV